MFIERYEATTAIARGSCRRPRGGGHRANLASEGSIGPVDQPQRIRALPDDLLDDGPPLYADTRRFVLHEGAVRNAPRYLVPLVGLEEQREALFAGGTALARSTRPARRETTSTGSATSSTGCSSRESIGTDIFRVRDRFLGGGDQSIFFVDRRLDRESLHGVTLIRSRRFR